MNEQEMAVALREAGYLVVKIPPCDREHGHGRHSLVTRSAMCEGSDPIPHGYASGYFGSFGWIVCCACGQSFNDYSYEEGPTPWDLHVERYSIDLEPLSHPGGSQGPSPAIPAPRLDL